MSSSSTCHLKEKQKRRKGQLAHPAVPARLPWARGAGGAVQDQGCFSAKLRARTHLLPSPCSRAPQQSPTPSSPSPVRAHTAPPHPQPQQLQQVPTRLLSACIRTSPPAPNTPCTFLPPPPQTPQHDIGPEEPQPARILLLPPEAPCTTARPPSGGGLRLETGTSAAAGAPRCDREQGPAQPPSEAAALPSGPHSPGPALS